MSRLVEMLIVVPFYKTIPTSYYELGDFLRGVQLLLVVAVSQLGANGRDAVP